MGNVSAAKKAGIAARIAAKQVGRTRTWNALTIGFKATTAHLGSVLHELWIEVTGFTFLSFAVIGLIALIHEYSKFSAGKSSLGHLLITAAFAGLFAWFGFSSFWRVWKKKGPN